ncbi:carboxylate-amine ligase [Streptomyces sp. 8N706]|uniref:carboxylate-amine ligase n=1 Tax=Streptomyces sp. 8N706 TaxID=3457416 RepID=UPI003FD663CF
MRGVCTAGQGALRTVQDSRATGAPHDPRNDRVHPRGRGGLLDPASGHPVPCAPEVLADVRAAHTPAAVPELKHELLSTQVESATGVCTRLQDLSAQLTAGRERLAAAAASHGALLVSSGTPPLAAGPAPVTDGERFRQIRDAYPGIVADYQVCGCHVHVGVPDRETAVAVVNQLRPWLPTLLALSANSPFHHGLDTGYASWRMVQQSRFPGSGVPPHFASAAAYEREVGRLVDCGALIDARMSFWLARPSPRFPTVEVRVADASITVEEAALQAALSRALVRTALTGLSAGRETVPVRDQVAAAAVWSASRYGLRGPGVHPVREKRVPATALVEALVRHVRAALEEAGDLDGVRTAASRLLAHGTGAERQRAAGEPAAAVRYVAHRTAPAQHRHRGGRP